MERTASECLWQEKTRRAQSEAYLSSRLALIGKAAPLPSAWLPLPVCRANHRLDGRREPSLGACSSESPCDAPGDDSQVNTLPVHQRPSTGPAADRSYERQQAESLPGAGYVVCQAQGCDDSPGRRSRRGRSN
jgi:hypothetical protein